MTGTSVKDVSSAFVNLPVSQGGKSQTGTGDFQKIWSAQMSKGTADGSGENAAVRENVSASAGKEDRSSQTSEDAESRPVQESSGSETENVQPQEQKVQEAGSEEGTEVKASGESTEEQGTKEAEVIPADGQEQAMEVLNTAAWNLLQQIADTFGMSPEEVQVVMEDMEMGQLDLLDASKLGKLLLNLGGAEDSYALIMDEGLYEQYQTLMTQRADAVSESAQTLETEPEQLLTFLKEEVGTVQEEPVVAEKISVTEESPAAEEEPVLPTEQTAVEGVPEEERAGRQSQGQSERQGAHSESREDRGEPINLFTQNIREQQFQPGLQQTGEVPVSQSWSTGTRQIMDQIMDYMKLQLTADTTNLEMQLHPASLGTLQVQLVSKGGMVTANFIAQNAAVKEALESQVVQLREQFEEQGVKVESIEVTVQTHEFERNLEQGRGRDPQETEKRGRSRRTRAGGAAVSGDLEEKNAPADDLITGGGSTVSYSA